MQHNQTPSGDMSAEQVIATAKALIMARSSAAAAQRAIEARRWRIFFLITLMILVIAFLAAPAPTLEQKFILALSGVCAQQHNLFVGGIQLPLCARDTGMYLSLLTTLGVMLLRGRGKACCASAI